jgi:hypothetical protein
LAYCRSAVTDITNLENQQPIPCSFQIADKSLCIEAASGKVSFSTALFDQVSWGKIGAEEKYIVIALKGDQKPVIIYSQNRETMDFWYDGLRSQMGIPPGTPSSLKMIETFQRAIDSVKDANSSLSAIKIPPPPENLNFPGQPSD